MQDDAELPNADLKSKNISDAFTILIKAGKLRIPGPKKDEIDAMVAKPKIMPSFEDNTACKGRTCLNCEGCASFQIMISEVREIIDRQEDMNEVPPMKAAEHALEQNMRDAVEMMQQISQRVNVQFSSWEILKFMRESVLTTLNIDIFKIKKEIKKGPKYTTTLSKDDWIVIRTVMIINKMDWWLQDVASQMDEKKDPNIFNLYLVDKQNHYYLPAKLSYIDKDGNGIGLKEWLDTQPNKIRNRIMTIQNNFGSAIESQVKWTVNYNH